MNVLDLDQEAFCAWLCVHEDKVVGYPGTCFQSPLAQWLSEMTGYVYGVDETVYGRASWDYRYWLRLPRWAQVFTARLEKGAFQALTGQQAFTILAGVEMALLPLGAQRLITSHLQFAM